MCGTLLFEILEKILLCDKRSVRFLRHHVILGASESIHSSAAVQSRVRLLDNPPPHAVAARAFDPISKVGIVG